MTLPLRPLRRPRTWLAVGLLMLMAVAIASLMPAGNLPAPPFPGVDKLEQLLTYMVLSAYGAMLFATRRSRGLVALALVGFGLVVEGLQASMTASRSADAVDAVANAAGVLLGWLFGFTRAARLLERIDAKRR